MVYTPPVSQIFDLLPLETPPVASVPEEAPTPQITPQVIEVR